MHDTIIRLKNGREISGLILKQEIDSEKDFGDSCIKLFNYNDMKPEIFYVRDIESAITKEDRISSSELGDLDVIKTMKQYYENFKDEDSCR